MPWDRRTYPANWAELRAAVQYRADDCCEACGVFNHAVGARDQAGDFIRQEVIALLDFGQCIRTFGQASPHRIMIVCTTAHKPGTSTLTQDVGDLLFLCQRCHLQLDRPRHLAKRAVTMYVRRIRAGQLLLGLEVAG